MFALSTNTNGVCCAQHIYMLAMAESFLVKCWRRSARRTTLSFTREAVEYFGSFCEALATARYSSSS